MTTGTKKVMEFDIPYIYAVRALMEQAEPYTKGNVTASIRLEVLIRDNYTCQLCGRNDKDIPLNVHHILPEGQEGAASMDNLVTLCWNCHKNEHKNQFDNIGAKRGAPPPSLLQTEPLGAGIFTKSTSLLREDQSD